VKRLVHLEEVAVAVQKQNRVGSGGQLQAIQERCTVGAWLDLTPRQNSSGGKNNLGRLRNVLQKNPCDALIRPVLP
jgi:hypothetical protein